MKTDNSHYSEIPRCLRRGFLFRSTSELLFDIPGSGYFSEPTALVFPGVPSGTNLRAGTGNAIRSIPEGTEGSLANLADNKRPYVGTLIATFPLRAISDPDADTQTRHLLTASYVSMKYDSLLTGQKSITSLLEYYDGSQWVPYDVKTSVPYYSTAWFYPNQAPVNPMQPGVDGISRMSIWTDPRTERFGSPWHQNYMTMFQPISETDASLHSMRPDASIDTKRMGFQFSSPAYSFGKGTPLASIGWLANDAASSSAGTGFFYPQALAENDSTGLNAYRDPDGVVRGGMSIYSRSSSPMGKPQATGQNASRPVVLNRPFRSVAELGYVFRDMPWKQLDFFTKESGDAALLDVFCIKEDATTDGTVAGRVNLNTRNPEVLEAVLKGAAKNEFTPSDGLTDAEAAFVANKLVAWTSSSPFRDVAELVNLYKGSYLSWLPTEMFPGGSNAEENILQRLRETPMRALADVGEARVWNLFVDIIAQTGFCGPAASGLEKFAMRGETRLWAHLAIDRATGKVIDRQIEYVTK